MRLDFYTKVILTSIAILLGLIAFRLFAAPESAHAQNRSSDLYIEPGYTLLRKPDGSANLKGKVVIDRRTGEVWGFPTMIDGPYPVDITSTDAPVSSPMYLGKFDFAKILR